MSFRSKNGKVYGWKPDVPDFRDQLYRLDPSVDAASLPQSVDLRPGMPEVWNQSELGSCTAHAIGAAVRYMQKKQKPEWDFMPSRLFIYYNERVVEGTVNEDSGAQIRTGIQVVNKLGVCKESYWPYVIAKFANKPVKAAFTNAAVHQALRYQRVPQTAVGIKSVLAKGLPVVFGFSVYESFESEEVARTGIVPMPGRNEKSLGGHAVCISGYDTAKKMFLVRNSWGSDWGDGGYFWMPEDYVLDENLSDDFWAVSQMEG